MVDSFKFNDAIKFVKNKIRHPLEEVPQYKLGDVTPEVFDAMDQADHYDVAFGDKWLFGLNPQQTLMVLKKSRSLYMAEVNKIQKEIDRITLLEMEYTDPRANTPWPRYYELRVRKEKQ